MKRKMLILGVILITVLGSYAQKSEIFTSEGKAIKGYDPVAFFTQNMPVKGDEGFQYNWKNSAWFFSSKENLEKFKADPEKYAPQYGGYCAYGTSEGHKAPTQTDTWTILDNKLYFNYNKKVKELWVPNQMALIHKADSLWPAIRDKN
ncbi:MAG: YHS domain-containing protein [Chitinophagaceae bacterium]|nr:YHS domain-containing protein [Bacteroidota bacterium]TAJ47346.1 MAG: YHS domain-containing protein [Chitinophagaceae bacterium]